MDELEKKNESKNIHILLLEDNPADVGLIDFELRESGIAFSLKHVDNKKDFETSLRKFHPDIILSDYDLPSFTGWEALLIRKEMSPEIPFILVTGAVGEERAIEVLTGGATDYVLKRNLSKLPTAVKRALHEAYEHRKRKEAEAERDRLFRELERRVEERTATLEAEIQDRKQAEEALHESEERLRTVTRAAGIGYFDIDLMKRTVYWSPELKAILGLPPDASPLPSGTIPPFIHPDDADIVKEMYRQYFDPASNGEIFSEHRVVRPDGSVRWVQFKGRSDYAGEGKQRHPIRVSGIVTDITERMKLEKELKKSEAEYRHIVEYAPTGIYEMNYTGPSFKRVNDAMCRILGYTREELLTINPAKIMDEESRTLFRERVIKKLAGEDIDQNVSFQILTKDGRKIQASLAITPLYENGKSTGALVVAHDITDLKNTHDALTKSEERFRVLVEASSEVIFSMDPDWTEMQRLHGHGFRADTDAPNGNWLEEYIPPQEQPRLTAAFQKAIRTKSVFELEHQSIQSDGAVGWTFSRAIPILNPAGEIVEWFGAASDITDRKRVEEALKDSEESLRHLIQYAPTTIFILDIRTGTPKIISVNEVGCTLSGYSREELLLMSPFDLLDEEGKKTLLEEIRKSLAGDIINDSSEYKIIGKGGREIFAVMDSNLIYEDGKVVGLLVVGHDITAMKEAENKRENIIDQLESINTELESFSYSVSHDLRAPLRAIDGFSSILLKRLDKKMNDDEKRQFNNIRDSAKQMNHLIDDILSLSRIGRAELVIKKIDMNKVAKSAWRQQLDAAPGIRADLKVNNLPDAVGDSSLLFQVFTNLLSNAAKFSRKKKKPVIEIGGTSRDSERIYYVKDNGIGFNMDYSNKLFGAFQRLHSGNDYEGTGIGLAIVQRIIHKHGGRVWAESTAGKGATFYFSLPDAASSKHGTQLA